VRVLVVVETLTNELAKSGSDPAHVRRRGSAKKRCLEAIPRRCASVVRGTRVPTLLTVIAPLAVILPVGEISTSYGWMFPPVRPKAKDGPLAADPPPARTSAAANAPATGPSLTAPG